MGLKPWSPTSQMDGLGDHERKRYCRRQNALLVEDIDSLYNCLTMRWLIQDSQTGG